jgi:hypothetical protein
MPLLKKGIIGSLCSNKKLLTKQVCCDMIFTPVNLSGVHGGDEGCLS